MNSQLLWEPLGRVSAERLADARRQLHWVAQAASAVGKRLLEHQPDYGEQSFLWLEEVRALAHGTVAGPRPFHSALRPSSPALLLLDGDGCPLRELPLDGRTLEEAFRWLEEEIAKLLGRAVDPPLDRSADIEAYPVGSGATFSAADAEAFAEMGVWFGNAHRRSGASGGAVRRVRRGRLPDPARLRRPPIEERTVPAGRGIPLTWLY